MHQSENFKFARMYPKNATDRTCQGSSELLRQILRVSQLEITCQTVDAVRSRVSTLFCELECKHQDHEKRPHKILSNKTSHCIAVSLAKNKPRSLSLLKREKAIFSWRTFIRRAIKLFQPSFFRIRIAKQLYHNQVTTYKKFKRSAIDHHA